MLALPREIRVLLSSQAAPSQLVPIPARLRSPLHDAYHHQLRHLQAKQQRRHYARERQEPRVGTTTPVPSNALTTSSKSPFYFEAGYALYAKRPSRPFPPPFLSIPSTSFSEPLSTHNKSRDRRERVNGEMIRGVTNGDDAVLVSDYFIGVDDGVGAWGQKERGHAALWSRLVLHFWAMEVEKALQSSSQHAGGGRMDPVEALQTAFEKTKEATSEPNQWFGTTTALAALLAADQKHPQHPLLYVTQLGDSQILVIRPRDREVIFKTKEQWHWFDCPRQLGTNSPDEPKKNAVLDKVEIEEDDIVVVMSDGVVDNLWEHEITENVMDSLDRWEGDIGTRRQKNENGQNVEPAEQSYADGMRFVAQELVNAARTIAEDPFAESPYMEKAVDEGLSIEGGKLDDISVVAAQCKRRKVV